MTAHYVYEFYDADSNPLYVGCTASLGPRFKQHACIRAWWPQVARIAVDVYPDFDSGSAAEEELIATLDPIHNVTHTPRQAEKNERVISGRIANQKKRHDLGLCQSWKCPTCIADRTEAIA